MADRKASVALELQAAQFKAEAAAAARSVDSLDRDVEKLDRDLNKIGPDAAKAGAAVGAMGAESKKASTSVEDLGKKTETLEQKTGKARDELGRFKKATEEGGTAAGGLGKKAEGLAADAEGLGKKLGGLTGDIEKVGSEAEKSGMSLGDLAGPAMIGGIAALVPPALALAGALTSVAAAGGIAGAGIAGAIAGNPQGFKNEWSTAIGSIKNDWIAASAPFVGPTLTAIRSIGPLVASWHIDTMFAKASTFVGPLVRGVEGFATGVEKGVAALVDKAGPEIAVLAAELPQIGQSIATALTLISDNSEGGAQSLHDFDVALEKIIITTGALISGSEALGGALTHANAGVKGFMDSIPGWVLAIDPLLILPRELADIFTPEPFKTNAGSWSSAIDAVSQSGALAGAQALATKTDFAALGTQLNDSTMNADKFAGSMNDKVFSSLLAADHATLGWAESLTHLSDSFTKNGQSIDINTAKGQANREAVLASVSANIQQYDSNIAAGMSAVQAAGQYDQNTAALERTLRKAGLTQAQVDSLIATYAKVPDATNTDILLHGFQDAIHDLEDMLARLFHINGYVAHAHVVVDETYIANRQSTYSQQVPKFKAQGGIDYAAQGMIVPPRNPGTVLFGEPQTGGELFLPLKGISQDRAFALTQAAGSAYGFQVSRASSTSSTGPGYLIYSGPTGGLDGFFATWLAEQSRKGNIQIHAKSVVA